MMPDVLDDPRTVVMQQVTNGIAVRMALLHLALSGQRVVCKFVEGWTPIRSKHRYRWDQDVRIRDGILLNWI